MTDCMILTLSYFVTVLDWFSLLSTFFTWQAQLYIYADEHIGHIRFIDTFQQKYLSVLN